MSVIDLNQLKVEEDYLEWLNESIDDINRRIAILMQQRSGQERRVAHQIQFIKELKQ